MLVTRRQFWTELVVRFCVHRLSPPKTRRVFRQLQSQFDVAESRRLAQRRAEFPPKTDPNQDQFLPHSSNIVSAWRYASSRSRSISAQSRPNSRRFDVIKHEKCTPAKGHFLLLTLPDWEMIITRRQFQIRLVVMVRTRRRSPPKTRLVSSGRQSQFDIVES